MPAIEIAQQPVYAPEQEVRLAVVMYGGVSLAIYMYGVTEELWRLVRATAPNQPEHARTPSTNLAFPQAESTEAVYRRLAQILPSSMDDATPTIRTRFIVDVVSGTSAGGINGICLAKALANETDLRALKDVWVKEGDIGVLVDDDESTLVAEDGEGARQVPELQRQGPPRSLLNGRRMLRDLVRALETMSGSAEEPFRSRLVEELDLFVTATDLDGLPATLMLDNAAASEKEHRHRTHFRYAPREGRNDFKRPDSAFLAYAARCTSAFPFAFEPMVLDTLAAFAPIDPKWSRYYRAYSRAEPNFANRAFSDGGILDNKPFSYAVETIGQRRAPLPVDRKLIFIEPDPAAAEVPKSASVWTALATAQAALLNLPRVETIRQDIQQVLKRNRAIQRVRDVTARFHEDVAGAASLVALTAEQPNETWAAQTLSETVQPGGPSPYLGPSYGTYHRIKVRGLVDYLATIITRAGGFNVDSDEAVAVAALVQAWKSERYDEGAAGGRQSDNAFLIDFDIPYRLRRVGFLLQKLRELTADDRATVDRALAPLRTSISALPDHPDRTELLRTFREGLHEIRWRLQQLERDLSSRDGILAELLDQLELTHDHLLEVLEAREPSAMQRRARELLTDQRGPRFDGIIALVRDRFAQAANDARAATTALLGEHTSRRPPPQPQDLAQIIRHALRFYYDAFDAYDLVLYTLQFETPIGEGHLVGIARISPQDATLPEVPKHARQLRGVSLHHFGAFLDEGWRRNDIVWGRLNAAECLMRTLLPDRPAEAENFIRDAHAIILDEYEQELADQLGRQSDQAWFETADNPDQVGTRKALTRAAAVIGELVEGLLGQQPTPERRLLHEAAAKRSGSLGRLLRSGHAHLGWRIAQQALDPEQSTLRATISVVLTLAATLIGELVAVAVIGATLILGGGATLDTIGWVILVVTGISMLLLSLVAAFTVRKLRKAVFGRVNAAIFSPGDPKRPVAARRR